MHRASQKAPAPPAEDPSAFQQSGQPSEVVGSSSHSIFSQVSPSVARSPWQTFGSDSNLPRHLSRDIITRHHYFRLSPHHFFKREGIPYSGDPGAFIACWSESMHDSFLPFAQKLSGFGPNA